MNSLFTVFTDENTSCPNKSLMATLVYSAIQLMDKFCPQGLG
jgi:hypothetical protein